MKIYKKIKFRQNKQNSPETLSKRSSSSLYFWMGKFNPPTIEFGFSYILPASWSSTPSANAGRPMLNDQFGLCSPLPQTSLSALWVHRTA